MNPIRCLSALAALALLGGLAPAWAADKVLVPGEPPLTQDLVDGYRQRTEWILDIQLTEQQRREWQKRLVAEFAKKNQVQKKQLASDWKHSPQVLRDMQTLNEPERSRKRAARRMEDLQSLRKSKDRDDQMLVAIYDAAYKPGGPKNPILSAGDPPLTQTMVDLHAAVVELLLDLELTAEQRQKFQQLALEEWKKATPRERAKQAKSLETWAKLPALGSYRRSVRRAFDQPGNLETWRKDASELSRWLIALHESSSTPGSERNPVLVDADPPLTQLVVDRYGDHLEIMLDLSVSGGLTTPKRKVLQGYLVKDWKNMSADQRKEFLGDLRTWSEAAARGTAEANRCIAAQRPKLLAQLHTARDDPRSQWLLEVLAQERQLVERWKTKMKYVAEMQKIVDEIRGNIGPRGHWEYNGMARRNVWVPDR